MTQEVRKKIKEYNYNYRLNNHEYCLKKDKERKEELHDNYVSFLICKSINISTKNIKIDNDTLETKRKQILLHRKLKENGQFK